MKVATDTIEQIDASLENVFIPRDALNDIIVFLRKKREE
jgi:hypothetical protein